EGFWGSPAKGIVVEVELAEGLGYHIVEDTNGWEDATGQKVLALMSPLVLEVESIEREEPMINPLVPSLAEVTEIAVSRLGNNPNGFFLVVEEDWIDSWGHHIRPDSMTWHVVPLDRAVGSALDFALDDQETLVIVTADHETGGLTNIETGQDGGIFALDHSTKEHTGQPVPLFAYGPGANHFTGMLDNTDIFRILN